MMTARRNVLTAASVLVLLLAASYILFHMMDSRSSPLGKITERSTQTKQTTNDKAAKKSASDLPQTEADKIVAALKTYCQTDYKRVWEGAYQITIDPTKVTAGYDNTLNDAFVVDGNYAKVAAVTCDTPQLKESQKFAAFTLYVQKTNGQWQAYDREQSIPECRLFDGKGWPASVVPQCSDSGQTRAPR